MTPGTAQQAVAALLQGGVCVLPTDTIYGLAACATDQAAVARLYAIKHREGKPGTLVAANTAQLIALGLSPADIARVDSLWPNPISIVLPAPASLGYIDQGKQSLAVRISNDPAFTAILEQTGPLLTSSANQPGDPPANTIHDAITCFGDDIAVYVDGGNRSHRAASTVAKLTANGLEVLRQGSVTIPQHMLAVAPPKDTVILGIESSCDETAVGIVKNGTDLLANVVASSMDLHAQYGGVIPEIAARSHIEAILPTIQQALTDAQCTWDDIDGIAVTQGAGLLGSLLVGVLTARTLALTHNKPLYAINHVEAHLYVNFITRSQVAGIQPAATAPQFPILGIIVSGGHSQLVLFCDHFDYTLLGQTQDDAIGEAYDKVAKILGLPYPGGINVSKLAAQGNPLAYRLPKARMPGKYDFSFSGVKTAVLRLGQELVGKDYSLPSIALPGLLTDAQKTDIAASFALTAADTIVDKVLMACEEFAPRSIIIGGGVAANSQLREQLSKRVGQPITYPDLKLCGDNGAMVATLGCYKAMHGVAPVDPLTLEVAPNLSM